MVYNKDFTRYHGRMNNDPRFFDYSSEEYRTLRAGYDIASSEADVAHAEWNRAQAAERAAKVRLDAARDNEQRFFLPLNEWYKQQNQAQVKWRKENRATDGPGTDAGSAPASQ